MILDVENFVESSEHPYYDINPDEIKAVHCYHATRVKDIASIEKYGLLIPTPERLKKNLKDIGISHVENSIIEEVIENNGANIFIHISRIFLERNCDFHICGSEKIRRIIKNLPEGELNYQKLLEEHLVKQTAYIVELLIPMEYMDIKSFWFDEEDLSLHESEEVADYTFEAKENISSKYIKNIYKIS